MSATEPAARPESNTDVNFHGLPSSRLLVKLDTSYLQKTLTICGKNPIFPAMQNLKSFYCPAGSLVFTKRVRCNADRGDDTCTPVICFANGLGKRDDAKLANLPTKYLNAARRHAVFSEYRCVGITETTQHYRSDSAGRFAATRKGLMSVPNMGNKKFLAGQRVRPDIMHIEKVPKTGTGTMDGTRYDFTVVAQTEEEESIPHYVQNNWMMGLTKEMSNVLDTMPKLKEIYQSIRAQCPITCFAPRVWKEGQSASQSEIDALLSDVNRTHAPDDRNLQATESYVCYVHALKEAFQNSGLFLNTEIDDLFPGVLMKETAFAANDRFVIAAKTAGDLLITTGKAAHSQFTADCKRIYGTVWLQTIYFRKQWWGAILDDAQFEAHDDDNDRSYKSYIDAVHRALPCVAHSCKQMAKHMDIRSTIYADDFPAVVVKDSAPGTSIQLLLP